MSISELVAIVAVVTALITAAIALRRAPGEARKAAAETRKLNEDAERAGVETQATIHKMVLDELDRVIVERDRVRAEHYNDVESLRKSVIAAEAAAGVHETERESDRAHISSLSETVVSLKLQIEGLTESNRQQALEREVYEKNLAEFVVAISHMQLKALDDDRKLVAYGKQVREYEARIGVLEARIEALEEENVKLIVKRGSE